MLKVSVKTTLYILTRTRFINVARFVVGVASTTAWNLLNRAVVRFVKAQSLSVLSSAMTVLVTLTPCTPLAPVSVIYKNIFDFRSRRKT